MHLPNQTLNQATTKGVVSLGTTAVANKFLSVAGQIILAWYLTPTDFGMIGLAYTVSSLVRLFQQLGVGTILVNRGKKIDLWISPAFSLCMIAGILAAASMCGLGSIAADYYNEPMVALLVFVLALAAPLNSLATIPRSILRYQLRFSFLAILSLGSSLASIGLTITFAITGFKAMSFVLPVPIVACAQALILYLHAKPRIRFKQAFLLRRWRWMLGDSLVVTCTIFIGEIALQSDYIIIGTFLPVASVGVYYFAYSISNQAILLFSNTLSSVMSASLSRLSSDKDRQNRGALKASTLLCYASIPFCYYQASIAAPLMQFAFDEKWNNAIPIVQILSVGMAWRSVGWVGSSLMEAQRRYRSRLILVTVGTLVLSASLLFAVPIYGILGAAYAVTIHILVFSPISILIAYGPKYKNLYILFLKPSLISLVPTISGLATSMLLSNTINSPLIVIIVSQTLVFIFVYIFTLKATSPSIFASYRDMIISLISKIYH